MTAKRQKIQNQLFLAFMPEVGSEAPGAGDEGFEAVVAKRPDETPAATESLMEEVCERENLLKAWKRVQQNKGSPGIDGMPVGDLKGFLRDHWPELRGQLLMGEYEPKPVRRVEIPKAGGGVRKLGIPTALDRFIQQALLQVLQRRWDPTFSESSYGFRPERSQHQAVLRAQQHVNEGHRWVVDLDLEKFFDRVNHDLLMGRIAKRVRDKRVLGLIRAFLNAGVMEAGLVSPTTEGTPQGGPLSPLLSNLMLDDLDRELEQRGLRFVRYADDCNIYVRSKRAGLRVKESITRFLKTKLKLKVNEEKSAVARPWDRKFLGFSFTNRKKVRRRIAPKSLERFKERIRELTGRNRRVSIKRMIEDLSSFMRGWRGYYGFCEARSVLGELDGWIRRRLRSMLWTQWENGRRRFAELVRGGLRRKDAARAAAQSRGPWRMSKAEALARALPNAYFRSLGLPTLALG